MKILLVLILSLPTSALSQSESLNTSLMKVMDTYLYSLKSKDVNKLKTISTQNFLKKMNKNLSDIFGKQNTNSPYKNNNFDLKFEKAVKDKDTYFVAIKDRSSNQYNDQRYVIKKIGEKFIIDDIVFFD